MKKVFRVRTKPTDSRTQIGVFDNVEDAMKCREMANPYHVIDEKGNIIKPIIQTKKEN